ncbi:deiodinase-like protein [Candidatus Poribacteria bacterium]
MKRLALITALVISFVLCLSSLSVYGQQSQQRSGIGSQRLDPNMITLLIRLMDLNRDRRISGGEYIQFFANMDQNKDGFIAQHEIMAVSSKKQQESADTAKKPSGPRVGLMAPDFALQALRGTEVVTLSSFKERRKPVVLVFASYTWQPFRDQAETLEKLYNKYKNKSEWLLVYLREIRPSDSQKVGANAVAETGIGQLETMEDRMAVARSSYSNLGLPFPAVVDSMDNKTEEAYAAWPDRIYIVDKNGRLAYKGEEGPEGFKPLAMERTLAKLCKN